jgi:L-iditol 2-dehydrogenase
MSERAAVMTGLAEMQIQDRPVPDLEPQQALVRIHAVGVCGSDSAYFRIGRIGDYVVDGPIVLGHETAGEVVALGDAVTNVAVGDRVAIEPGTPCRQCRDLIFLATPPYDGCLQEVIAIDSRNLFLLPASMTYEEGALLEPLSVGIWGCNRAQLGPGEDVLVSGAGPVGLLAAATARAFGAATVTVTDVAPFRLEAAAAMGFAVEKADQMTPGMRFDVLLECAGAPTALAEGLWRLRPAGRAAMIGMPKQDVTLALAKLNPQELTISTVNRYAHTWPIAISLVASGRVDVKPLVTHHFPLQETADALTLAQRVPDSIKAVVHPQL